MTQEQFNAIYGPSEHIKRLMAGDPQAKAEQAQRVSGIVSRIAQAKQRFGAKNADEWQQTQKEETELHKKLTCI